MELGSWRMRPRFRENKLLVEWACLAAPKRIRLDDIDLTYVVSRAIENGVFLHVYMALDRVAKKETKEDEGWRQVKNAYFQYTSNLARWFDESIRLASLFRDNGIHIMPAKGLLLSHLYYPDKFLRFSSDVDFVFRTDADREKAGRVLSKMGYGLRWSSPKESSYHTHFGRVSMHCETHSFIASISGTYEYPILGGLWSNSSPGTIGGVDVSVMRPEHAFMILCLHAFSEGIFSLRDLSDAHQILRASRGFDWGVIADHIEVEGWRHILYLPFNIIAATKERFMGATSIPDDVLEIVGTGAPHEKSKDIMSRMLEQRGWAFPVLISSLPFAFSLLRSPHLMNVLAPRAGQPRTLAKSLMRAMCELYLVFGIAKRDYGSMYGLECLRGWMETYIASPPVGGRVSELAISS